MKINKDYKIALKTGHYIEKNTYRKEYNSAYILFFCILFALFLIMFGLLPQAKGEEIQENLAIHCILGEARGEGTIGMLAVAEALRNRGTTSGVYGCDASFSEPSWIWDLAKTAWKSSKTSNLVHGADHWESTDFKAPYWVKSMTETAHIGKHKFYKK